MALKAVKVVEVPHLDEVQEGPSAVVLPASSHLSVAPLKERSAGAKGFMVVGHRGRGMNAVASVDARMRGAVRENSLRSFNQAARFPIDLIEFDVQELL